MEQSTTPQYLKCYKCFNTPKEFIVLLCNHSYCHKCAKKNIKHTNKYRFIECICGYLTYFDQKNKIISSQETLDYSPNWKRDQKKKSRKNLQQRKTAQNISRLNFKNQLNQRLSIPLIQASSIFSLNKSQIIEDSFDFSKSPQRQKYLNHLNTSNRIKNKSSKINKTLMDQSLLIQNDTSIFDRNKFIAECSTHNIKQKSGRKFQQTLPQSPKQQQNQSLLISKNKQTSKSRNKQRFSTQKSKIDKKNQIKIHFQNQISFLKILYNKNIEQIEYQFKKILKKINNQFIQLQNELKSLYFQSFITTQSLNQINLSNIVNQRYQFKIGNKLKLIQNILFQIDSNGKFLNSIKLMNKNMKEQKLFNKNKLSQFDIVEENWLTSPKRKQIFNYPRNITLNDESFNNYNQLSQSMSLNRLQTQNIHQQIKRNRNNYNYMNENEKIYDIYSSKPNLKRLKSKQQLKNPQKLRNNFIYFSPPLNICQKHLQKRSKQTKNYISYIQKLCHDKKMKNNQDLFKKVKQSNTYQFKR